MKEKISARNFCVCALSVENMQAEMNVKNVK